MRILNHFLGFVGRTLRDETGALTFTVVKRFKPQAGIRRGIIDITFDTGGPTWTVTVANLGLQNAVLNLTFASPHIDGFIVGTVPVAGNATVTISAMEEADGAGAMQAIDASDLSTKVMRAEYTGY